MPSRTRVGVIVVAAGLIGLTSPMGAARQRGPERGALPDFDIREGRSAAAASSEAAAELQRRAGRRGRDTRLHVRTGAVRVLDDPGLSVAPGSSAGAVRGLLRESSDRLGLGPRDLEALELVRDYVSASTGLRHLIYSQSFDGIPVHDALVALHVAPDGRVVRVTSSAARGAGRSRRAAVPAGTAAVQAAANVRPDSPFVATPVASDRGSRRRARFARGPFLRDVDAALTWFPVDGGLQLAWQIDIEPDGDPQAYDVLVSAETGEVLLRRNRVLDAEGSGRVIQSAPTRAIDPRRPDATPTGSDGCPPPLNHEFISLNAPFRDAATVLFGTGRLAGNNTHVFHRNVSTEAPAGVFDGTGWSFDFPFNSAGSASTTLFYAVNYAHDFFYDLGFDEPAGNFQQDNFGRGGLGNDSVRAVARATGRNNATYQHAADGSSPTISMFLWDGTGCWAQDTDGDGTLDIDGDYDLDIVIHEFHHGVSLRLNPAFTGNEAGAIGEGASDFFAYSVNGNTTLAEYARPGGLRSINSKTYGDWFCFLGIICEPHDNGEIFANALWDVRERFRVDGVRGSEAAAINESHQIYVDGLKLSPPAPTMLDIRDAMLMADQVRNPGAPNSQNFCRIWESFAGRGMGLDAADTADNGFNSVTANYQVPEGCVGPPPPPTVSVSVSAATATEAGPTPGAFTISRGSAQESAVTVSVTLAGSAINGTDYVTVASTATIPAGAATVDVQVTPVDDTLLESSETVVLTLRAGTGYLLGSPSSGTVTIVSDDVAPDFLVSALTGPQAGGAGLQVQVSDTTLNQGTGASEPSVTSFYLSTDVFLDAGDDSIGSRTVPALAVGGTSAASTTLTLPLTAGPGVYRIIAKADGPAQFTETNENNNLRSVSIRIGPDLAITAFTAPSAAGEGSTFSVTETTTNQGGGPAEPSETRFYLSANSTLDASDQELHARAVGSLAPGGSSTAQVPLAIPAGTPTGTYYLFAKADGADTVAEAIENNNTRFVSIRIGPDLLISAISGPSRGETGGTIAVTETTRNAGAGTAGASTTAIYLSSDFVFDAADYRLTPARSVGALPASGFSTATTTVTLPAVSPGTWYLIARADDLGVVGETLETNNTRHMTIGLGPDLDVTAFSAPTTVVAGAAISVSDTVRNLGGNAAGPSVTRLYLSLNPSLDSGDVLLGERAVGPLVTNATSVGPTTVTIPTGLSGRYYLIAAADGAGTIAESSETNNTAWRTVTINP
jgi:subtilase family serine protease